MPLGFRWCPRLTSARPPWRAPYQGVPEAPRATGRHPAPQGTDKTGGWGRAAARLEGTNGRIVSANPTVPHMIPDIPSSQAQEYEASAQ